MRQPRILNRMEIQNIILDQQLKRWWIAEQTGVHVTTLRRWLSGEIQTVRNEHVFNLARVLEVDYQRLVLTGSPN